MINEQLLEALEISQRERNTAVEALYRAESQCQLYEYKIGLLEKLLNSGQPISMDSIRTIFDLPKPARPTKGGGKA